MNGIEKREIQLSKKMEERRGFRIVGRVQGVFFRVWTRDLAKELGLRGTVRNRMDGSVEARAEGDPGALRMFESRLWDGPPASVVERVTECPVGDPLPPGPFTILPTE